MSPEILAHWMPAFAGAAGGFVLGLVRLIMTMAGLSSGQNAGQAIGAHVLLAFMLALVGGTVAYFTSGIAGSFITGVTGLALILLLAGDFTSKEGEQ